MSGRLKSNEIILTNEQYLDCGSIRIGDSFASIGSNQLNFQDLKKKLES